MTMFSWVARLRRGSLLVRFSLLSLVVLACIAAGLVAVLQQDMEQDALQQQADEVAVVVQGVMGHYLVKATSLSPVLRRSAWWNTVAQELMQADAHLVRIKMWDTAGRVVYSNNPRQIGQRFVIDDNLRLALSGHPAMDISHLSDPENAGDRTGHSALLETYIPIRGRDHRVIGAYEAYSDLGPLNRRIVAARDTIWISVAAGFVLLYASLFVIVRGASRRLVRQMHEIAQLGAQAREAETLRQVDRLKDEFIGGVSHELRRPLASIKGYAESLLLPDARWNSEEQREFLQVIDEEADHLARLIDNLLDVARLGSGSLPLTREPLHLPALAEQAVRRVRSYTHLPAHPYEVRFPERFPYVDGDNERVMQVLLNLLENAAKYAPEGTPITVEGHITSGMAAVSVRDQGPGLTKEQAAHVFDTFYRVDSGLRRATDGTGLGLAICRGVVEAHGGSITVDTAPGRGCTFMFTLPISPESISLPETPTAIAIAAREQAASRGAR